MCDISQPIEAAQQFMTAGGTFEQLLRHDNLIPVLAIAVGSVIAVAAIISSAIRSVCQTRAVELTKREMAAYVAEGSIDPDKAVAMINAGSDAGGDEDE
jgi:hypothetical protein